MTGTDVDFSGQARLLHRLAEVLDVAVEELTLDASLVEDLGVDSLGMVEVTAALEEWNVPVSERELWEIETVRDVVSLYLAHERDRDGR